MAATKFFAAAFAVLIVSGCTLNKQEAPALTGPSGLGTSISISVSPDSLTEDGASQSIVTITALDSSGNPMRNLSLTTAVLTTGGIATDAKGTLSSRNLVTDSSGHAVTVFTAPKTVLGVGAQDILLWVTPSGTDFGNDTARVATIHLIPSGPAIPPIGNVSPKFTVTPVSPSTNQSVLFDASGTTSTSGVIVSYAWDFGDGGTASGITVSHVYGVAGTYVVRMTATDSLGASNGISQSITVGNLATGLRAIIVVSPNPPVAGQPTHFDASTSVVTPPHTIVSYQWNFGDGDVETTTSPRIDHVYGAPARGEALSVVLIVTDDTGQTNTATVTFTPQ